MTTFDDPELERALLLAAKTNLPTLTVRRLESRFRANIVDQIHKLNGLAQPIESSTGVGIPDMYCAVSGLSFWLELKMEQRQLGSVTKLRFRAGQREWLLQNMLGGGRSLAGVHFLDGYAFVRGDALACTGGSVPFGDERFAGYVFTQNTLNIKNMLVWAEHAFTLPLLTDKLDKEPIKLAHILTKRYIKDTWRSEDEGDPDTGGN